MPAMRSAYIERFAGGPDAVTFFSHEEYLDPDLLDAARYRSVGRRRLLRLALRADFDVLAVPEPFWIAELPFSTALALTARIGGLLRARPIRVVTYAIENSDASRLLGLPNAVPAPLRLIALSIAVLPLLMALSKIAFGTDDARSTYLRALPPPVRSRIQKRSATFLPLSPACHCLAPVPPHATALFLGPLETRKGLDTLLDAWEALSAVRPDARLVVCGEGALQPLLDEALSAQPSIRQVRGAARPRIHELLRGAGVIVSLPRPERRWREQIGLSVPEGIAHGCHVVTTRQTGISAWLESEGQSLVSAPSSRRELVEALVAALDHPHPIAASSLPRVSGRAEAEWWLSGQDGPRAW